MHNPILQTPSNKQLILSHHLSLTFCWAFPLPRHVQRITSFLVCIRSQTCSFDTREEASIYMRGFYKSWIGMELRSFYLQSFPLCCLILLRVCLPLRQSWPSNLVREKTIVLLVSDLCHRCRRSLSHDWNCMSLFWNIVHVPSTENTLPLSSQRRRSFLFDSWWLILFPQLPSGLWSFEFSSSDQYEVLQMSSTVNNLSVYCLERFLDRTKPGRSDSWTKSCNYDLYNPPRIISVGISPTDNRALVPPDIENLGRHHSANL